MDIRFQKTFIKAFEHLPPKQQQRVEKAVNSFQTNPIDRQLRNHPLKGKYKDYRSISAGGDLRLVFREIDNYETVYFIRVGSHVKAYE